MFSNCLGDDWECQLENEGRSSSADDENVYGVNNLSYLKEQIKGYDIDDDDDDNEHPVETNDGIEAYDEDDKENVLITMSNNGTMLVESSVNANSSGNEIESSGDGEIPDDQDLEDKSSYIPIPTPDKLSEKLVASQLQRLTQLIKTASHGQNDANELSPDELNQFLAEQKLKVKKFHSNKNAVPVPHNKFVEDHHLEQILDLQKKLNNLANNRNAYSTPAPPIKHTITNGYYPAEATSVHIKATNALESPQFPHVGSASSQIVVNRPGGTVVFRLPYSNPPAKKADDKKPDEQISADTLKMILELSKHMSNRAPNTPNFVHSLPPQSPTSDYAQQVTPIVQPAVYNLPWDQLTSLTAYMNALKSNKYANEQESMEKISSVSGTLPANANTASDPDDIGPTTIIHNHIPITVSNPSPTNSILNRLQNPPPIITSTMRPTSSHQYDSYGNKRPMENIDLNNYYPFPPFSENIPQKHIIQHSSSVPSTALTYSSSYSTQQSPFSENFDQPQYIKIAQSQPDHVAPQYSNDNHNAVMHNIMGPIPTFVSVNGGYTNKVFSTYAPQPHLSEGNVNDYVPIDEKPYPTLRPTNYVPIATASSPTPSYANPPESYTHVKKQPHIFDKVDRFDSFAEEPNENDNGESNEEFVQNQNNNYHDENIANEDYVNSNVEQIQNDNSNENVMSLLANYNSQIKATAKTTPMTINEDSNETKPTFQYKPVHKIGSHQKHKQIVSLNGNFLSMETYQQSIEPFLEKGSLHDLQIQVLTCATGVRQANSSDCTRYFVCNEKTGKVLSYKCPPYTAFNANIKICNGETYVKCFSDGISNEVDVPDTDKIFHHRIQQEIIEANRVKSEAHKAQQLAQLLKLQTNKIVHSAPHVRYKQQMSNGGKSTPPMIPPTRPSHKATKRPHRKPSVQTSNVSTQQKRPAQSAQHTNTKVRGKRKIPCKEEGKLPDNLSIRHYFLCFKDQTKTMRARRMICPAKLHFCPSTLVCTSTERCSKKLG